VGLLLQARSSISKFQTHTFLVWCKARRSLLLQVLQYSTIFNELQYLVTAGKHDESMRMSLMEWRVLVVMGHFIIDLENGKKKEGC